MHPQRVEADLNKAFHIFQLDMGLPSSLQYIYDLQRIGIKFGLTNTKRLLSVLGDPHLDLSVIHISGTNGKGSTAAMIAAILKAAGYKIGLYTSPHLIDLSERIQINGNPIPIEDLIREAEKIRNIANRINFKGSHPTYFEAITCLAFYYFKKQGVDFAVMETGMGGRLDATNVCVPKVTVITNISFDHQEYLGSTLSEIAREKAGIIKPGCPLVSGVTQKDAKEIIQRRCKSEGVPIYNIFELYHVEEIYPKTELVIDSNIDIIYNNTHPHIYTIPYFNISRRGQPYLTVKIALYGRFQIQNTLLALETIERLKESGIMITDKAIKDGLSRTVWPGRMQLISQNPYLILDGAHNPSAAQCLAEAIKAQFGYKDLVLVLGILKDKDITGICKSIASIASHIILSSPKSERAASAEELFHIVKSLRIADSDRIYVIPSVSEAICKAKALASNDDLILVTGSLYTIGEAMSYLDVKPYSTQVKNYA